MNTCVRWIHLLFFFFFHNMMIALSTSSKFIIEGNVLTQSTMFIFSWKQRISVIISHCTIFHDLVLCRFSREISCLVFITRVKLEWLFICIALTLQSCILVLIHHINISTVFQLSWHISGLSLMLLLEVRTICRKLCLCIGSFVWPWHYTDEWYLLYAKWNLLQLLLLLLHWFIFSIII